MSPTRQPSRPGAPSARATSAGQAPALAPPEQAALPIASRAVLLTPDQAADMLGVTPRVLERWRGCGDGPVFVRLTRKTIRYRIENIEAFISANLRTSTAPGAEHVCAA